MNWNTTGTEMGFDGRTGKGVGAGPDMTDLGKFNATGRYWDPQTVRTWRWKDVWKDVNGVEEMSPSAEEMLLAREAGHPVATAKIGRCYHSDDFSGKEEVEEWDYRGTFRQIDDYGTDESDWLAQMNSWIDDVSEVVEAVGPLMPPTFTKSEIAQVRHTIAEIRRITDLERIRSTNNDAYDHFVQREPIRKMVHRYEDPKPRGKTSRRIYLGVPKMERDVPYSGGVRYELDRVGYDSYSLPRNIHNFRLCLEHEIAQRETELDAWLQGRRVLKVDGLYYWGDPVERITSIWDFTLEITGYRQTTLLTTKDIEILNSLDSREKAKAFGEKESIGNLVPYWRYPHWEKRRSQSWKHSKSRDQYRNVGGRGNPFKGMDGFIPSGDDQGVDWNVDNEEEILVNVEAYNDLIALADEESELDALEWIYNVWIYERNERMLEENRVARYEHWYLTELLMEWEADDVYACPPPTSELWI